MEGDVCGGDSECRQGACRTHCCKAAEVGCRTACGNAAVAGACYPALEIGAQIWSTSNFTRLGWPKVLYAKEIAYLSLDQPSTATDTPAALRNGLARKHAAAGTFQKARADQLNYILRWTPSNPKASSDIDYTKDYIGGPPPPGLEYSGRGGDPLFTSANPTTGELSTSPANVGRYTAWVILEDERFGAEMPPEYSAGPNKQTTPLSNR